MVAISGIFPQEQEWNGKTVLRPIAYRSKVLSDTEMKYGAPKAAIFAVVTFVEKYRSNLGSEPFKLRVDNRALSWLKTYSMGQSYIGRWIVRQDGYGMIIEHRTRDKHHNANILSKKTEFYKRQEQKDADRQEIKDGFSFTDKEMYDSLPIMRSGKSGKPIEDHPELPAELETKEILKRKTWMPMEMTLKSKVVRETLKVKSYDPDEVKTGRITIGEELRRLLEKLADDKPGARNNDRDETEVTILKRGGAAHDENSTKGNLTAKRLCGHWSRRSQRTY